MLDFGAACMTTAGVLVDSWVGTAGTRTWTRQVVARVDHTSDGAHSDAAMSPRQESSIGVYRR